MNAMSTKPAQVAANAPRRAFDSITSAATDRAIPSVAAAPPPPPSSANAVNAVNAGGAPASKTAADARSAAPGRQFSRPMQLQEAITTATGATAAKSRTEIGELEGCFQFREDSTNSAATRLPPRFALVNAGGISPRVVRSVSPEGRVDSIVPGGSWQRMTPDVVRVQFANDREHQPLTLQITAGAITSQAGVGGRNTTLRVARIDCRP
jgi:hypothetical protein